MASVEDLGELGAPPHNDIEIKFMNASTDTPSYVLKLGRNDPVSLLLEALTAKIDVPAGSVSLVCEGSNVEGSKTVKDNGIVEPGPAARRRGAKVQLVGTLAADVQIGQCTRQKEKEEEETRRKQEKEKEDEEKKRVVNEAKETQRKRNMTPLEREAEEIKDEVVKRYLGDLRKTLVQKAKQVDCRSEQAADTIKYPNMSAANIRVMLRVHVPDIDERIAPRTEGKPTIELIVETYENGIPNYAGPTSDYLRLSLRRSLSMIREADEENKPGVGRRRALCLRLADAFEACQAVQARVIEQLGDELAEGPLFEREVRSMVVELKERNLDKTIMALFPTRATEAAAPGADFAHMMNTYRQALGITRIDHKGTDRLAAGGGGDTLSQTDRTAAEQEFNRQLDVIGLTDDFVRDVNQPSGATERRIDRDGFAKWAGEHTAVSHRIYFNEEDEARYEGRPVDKQDFTQPFLHRELAIEILHMVLVQECDASKK